MGRLLIATWGATLRTLAQYLWIAAALRFERANAPAKISTS